MPDVRSLSGTKRCGCCGRPGCPGCSYVLVLILSTPRPSDASLGIGIIPGSDTEQGGAESITDDLPNTCSPRVYIAGIPGSCPLLSDLQTEFGSGCVADRRSSATVLKNLATITNLDGTFPACDSQGRTILKVANYIAGQSYRLYQVCDNGTSECVEIQTGTVIPPNTGCGDGPDFATISFLNTCCCGCFKAPYTLTDGVTFTGGTVTSASAHFSSLDLGATISGGSIPGGATIVGVGGPNTITVFPHPTAAASGVTLTITPLAPSIGIVTGTGSVVVSGHTTTQATGIVSCRNFYSWDGAGADGVNLGTTVSGVTTGGVGFTVTVVHGDHFERRNSHTSYSGSFTSGEALLFLAPSSPPTPGTVYTLMVQFDQPVHAAGFRIQQNTATFRDDFFMIPYSGGLPLTPVPPTTYTGLGLDASAPGTNSATFYGADGGCCCSPSPVTFDGLLIGIAGSIGSGPSQPFAISTLEVEQCYTPPPPPMMAAKVPEIPRPSCVHLGEPSGEKIQCVTCTGKVMLKVFECEIFGTCTVGKSVEGKACCETCNKWEPANHLPVAQNGTEAID